MGRSVFRFIAYDHCPLTLVAGRQSFPPVTLQRFVTLPAPKQTGDDADNQCEGNKVLQYAAEGDDSLPEEGYTHIVHGRAIAQGRQGTEIMEAKVAEQGEREPDFPRKAGA